MKLPFLVSLPHAGLDTPDELKEYCVLSHEGIVKDGDEQAWDIYSGLESIVEGFQTTSIARAFVDLNRASDDIRLDGVVKTHTTWNQPIYNRKLENDIIELLIAKYWKPYHEALSRLGRKEIKLGIDCHTMAAIGPPVGPDTGKVRPAVCLSNSHSTCPDEWIQLMKKCFEDAFNEKVRINDPFTGGYITKYHSTEMPWIQIEISRGDFMSVSRKEELVLEALTSWTQRKR